MGGILDGGPGGAGDVVDLLLIQHHAFGVFLERHVFARLGLVALEQEQFLDFVLVGLVDLDAFLEHLAELPVETEVILLRFLHHRFQLGEDLGGDALFNLLDDGVFLQDFSRDIERKVIRLDYTLDEAQVTRQQRLAIVHDEDPLHVKVDAVLGAFLLEHVERRLGRQVQQRLELNLALGGVMDGLDRVGVVV